MNRAATRVTARALAVAGATVAALAGWAVAGPVAGADLIVDGDNGRTLTVDAGAVIFLSVLAGLAGWALLAALERVTARARVVWAATAAVVFLLSFLPLTGSTATTGTRISLGLLHVLVAAVLIPAMLATSRTTTSTDANRHR